MKAVSTSTGKEFELVNMSINMNGAINGQIIIAGEARHADFSLTKNNQIHVTSAFYISKDQSGLFNGILTDLTPEFQAWIVSETQRLDAELAEEMSYKRAQMFQY